MPQTSTDRLTDSQDHEWTAGPVLGRGTWGRTRTVRDASGREAVLKEPLTEADFPADAPRPDDLVAACVAAASEQAELLSEAKWPWLPRLESTVELGGGRIGLVMPRYVTLADRLASGQLPLAEVLRVVVVVSRRLVEAHIHHGSLHPGNVLVNDRGEPVLSDVVTPSLHPVGVRLAELAGARGWRPPEASGPPTATWDTWALGQVLHGAAMAVAPTDDGMVQRAALPADGLDKLALATLRDRVLARLATEGSNPRFRSRLAERLAAVLNRALSADHEPSPPYRFADPGELADRTDEVLALARPAVEDVGKLLLPAGAPDGVFQGEVPVTFTVSVGCTPGVDDHEDLVCGLQVVDLDAEGDGRVPIEDARFDVERHPSGRLRYKFGLPELRPGRYRVTAAFSVKDGGDDPRTARGDLEVRPPPGYVPPSEPPPEAPLRLDPVAPPSDAAPSGDPPSEDDISLERIDAPSSPVPSTASDPGGELIEGMFPRPIAPPEDDEPSEVEPEPVAAPGTAAPVGPVAVPTEPPSAATPVAPPPDPPDADPPDEHTATVAAGLRTPPPPPHVTTATVDEPVEREFFAHTDAAMKDLGDVDFSPDAGEDLPTQESNVAVGGLPGPIQRILDTIRRDSYIAVGAAVAASLVLVLVLTAVLKAC